MTFVGTLRPYQEAPVEFMKQHRTVLLAAEQGTGKTPMTIKALEDQFDDQSIRQPGLWVTLGTLMYQTATKIEEFTQGSSTAIVVPSGSDSSFAERQEIYHSFRDEESADYLILSYEAVKNDWDEVSHLPKGFMVVDEISFIRGFQSDRAKSIKALGKGVPVRYGLTGTPIENGKPEEFYSIFEFIDPSLFGRWDIFDRTFIKRNKNGWPERYVNLETFHDLVASKMVRLRSSDPDVSPYMPKKRDGIDGLGKPILVKMTDQKTKALYDYIAGDLLFQLEKANRWGHNFDLSSNYGRTQKMSTAADKSKGLIAQRLQALMMLCDHPELLRISAAKYASTKTGGNGYIAELEEEGLLADMHTTPKLDRLEAWIDDVLSKNPANKVVVFTRYVDMIRLIAERYDKSLVETYSGRMTQKRKNASLTRFQTDLACRILVSSDAGGFGLDIPQANYSINYDLPDGAGAADQRDTRIDRTSSEFDWISRNWIMIEDSIEERNFSRLAQKRAVASGFVDRKGLNAKGGIDLTAKTVTKFLVDAGIKPRS